MMRKSRIVFVVLTLFFIAAFYEASAQESAITQGELARLIGEELGYKTEHIANLKKIGITPLGEWDEGSLLTKDDFDAILIRMARRSPVVENKEPPKILDPLGFPARDISREGVKRVLASDAFKRATINSKMILCPALLPLPPGYKAVLVATKEGLVLIDVTAAAAVAPAEEITPEQPPEPPPEPPDPHK